MDDFLLLSLFWIISICVLWIMKELFFKNVETQARLFISYVLITGILFLYFFGHFFLSDNYKSNLITEITGISITVFLIDRIYGYINKKYEQLYRKLALQTCRMPIYSYCANWLFIFESNNEKCNERLAHYNSLEEFFTSDEFRNKVKAFDFNKYIGENKTYAQYYDEKMSEVKDKFQSILVKYASKLPYCDLKLIEHFGGKAYMFSIFAIMKFISEAKFTYQHGDREPKEIKPFNNSFKDISNENFPKHFVKLIQFIDEYNSVVDEHEKWTIRNINQLNTIATMNNNPLIDW